MLGCGPSPSMLFKKILSGDSSFLRFSDSNPLPPGTQTLPPNNSRQYSYATKVCVVSDGVIWPTLFKFAMNFEDPLFGGASSINLSILYP